MFLSDLLEASTSETDLISSNTDLLSINSGDPLGDTTPGTDTVHTDIELEDGRNL